MSGHSKWHNIQQRKGQQDAKKANLFTKLGRGITIAAQKSGGDMAMNFALRLAVEKAKAGGMSKDNIEKSVKRGTGELKEGLPMEEALYEAFGPGGAAILIKTTTDNKNRTVSDLKHILSKYGGSLGGPGSVLWNFGEWGVAVVNSSQSITNRDEFEIELIEAGAEDITEREGGTVEIKTKVENLQKVLQKLKELKIESVESGLRFIAKEKSAPDTATEEKLAELFSELEAHDDVEDYFTNAE